jgi:protein-disulfide isomerase
MSHCLKSTLCGILCLALSSIFSMSAEETSGHILGGSLNSPIRVEIYSDFQCPHCRDLYLGTVKPLLQEYSSKDKVCVIYHEFPLDMHPYSREAARYIEAAAQLGQQKLLPVYDAIFTDQAQWSQDGKLEGIVTKALTQDDFLKVKKILRDPIISVAIEKGIELGLQNKVTSTPTLFFYYIGKQQRVEGLVTYPVMKQFVDSIVK